MNNSICIIDKKDVRLMLNFLTECKEGKIHGIDIDVHERLMEIRKKIEKSRPFKDLNDDWLKRCDKKSCPILDDLSNDNMSDNSNKRTEDTTAIGFETPKEKFRKELKKASRISKEKQPPIRRKHDSNNR